MGVKSCLVILIAGTFDLLSSGKATEQGLRAANSIGIPNLIGILTILEMARKQLPQSRHLGWRCTGANISACAGMRVMWVMILTAMAVMQIT